jgi:hypothetical protein
MSTPQELYYGLALAESNAVSGEQGISAIFKLGRWYDGTTTGHRANSRPFAALTNFRQSGYNIG